MVDTIPKGMVCIKPMTSADANSHGRTFVPFAVASQTQRVRVLCVATDGRVLLMHWRDPESGALLWEPPGGGVHDGESTRAAGERELREETGLSLELEPLGVQLRRTLSWAGRRDSWLESYFAAKCAAPLVVSNSGMQPDELPMFNGYAWVHWRELSTTTDPVVPRVLPALVARLLDIKKWDVTKCD